jgi:hypothetical protein
MCLCLCLAQVPNMAASSEKSALALSRVSLMR